MADMAFEAVIFKYPEVFSADALAQSKARMAGGNPADQAANAVLGVTRERSRPSQRQSGNVILLVRWGSKSRILDSPAPDLEVLRLA
jgi:hypothetical protein